MFVAEAKIWSLMRFFWVFKASLQTVVPLSIVGVVSNLHTALKGTAFCKNGHTVIPDHDVGALEGIVQNILTSYIKIIGSAHRLQSFSLCFTPFGFLDKKLIFFSLFSVPETQNFFVFHIIVDEPHCICPTLGFDLHVTDLNLFFLAWLLVLIVRRQRGESSTP